jgi:hypothetical protein
MDILTTLIHWVPVENYLPKVEEGLTLSNRVALKVKGYPHMFVFGSYNKENGKFFVPEFKNKDIEIGLFSHWAEINFPKI